MLETQQPGKQDRNSDHQRMVSHVDEWALLQGSDGQALSEGILEVGGPAKEAGYRAGVLQEGQGNVSFHKK